MTQTPSPDQTARDQMIAIRQARRYLRANTGTLARILNAYKASQASGTAMGHLSEQ